MTTRNDDTPSVAEPQPVPEAVQWAVNVHRAEALRLKKIDADIEAMTRKISEYETYLAEVKANRKSADEARVRTAKNAAVALEMAENVCAMYGWPVPAPEGEPPLNQAGQFPAVPPDGATQVIPAVPFGEHPWQHVRHGQKVTAYLVGGGSFTGVVMECPPETLVLHNGAASYELEPGEVLRVEPAEVSDQVTATPAQAEAGE